MDWEELENRHVPHRIKNRANSKARCHFKRNGAWNGLDLLMMAFSFVLSFLAGYLFLFDEFVVVT
jgi:hypothetical protein